jgi:hypothetical protein
MLFSSLFSYAHTFSELILDCRAKIVLTKLLAMLIANFIGKHYLCKNIS